LAKRQLPTVQPIPLFYPTPTDPITYLLSLPLYLLFLPLQMLAMITQGISLPTLPAMRSPTHRSSRTFYENIEEWILKEMPNGSLKITVHRKAHSK